MKIKIAIPYRGEYLKIFVYKIPAWLVIALVIVATIALAIKLYQL